MSKLGFSLLGRVISMLYSVSMCSPHGPITTCVVAPKSFTASIEGGKEEGEEEEEEEEEDDDKSKAWFVSASKTLPPLVRFSSCSSSSSESKDGLRSWL